MKKRSPIAVLLLPFITFGIYSVYWLVATKIEMNQQGAKIPTAWLLIVPFVNIWWLYKYSEGVEQTTKGKTSTVLAFILLFLLGFIGQAIIQASFNETAVAATPAIPAAPASAEAPAPAAAPASVPTATPSVPATPAADVTPKEEPPQPPAGPLVQ